MYCHLLWLWRHFLGFLSVRSIRRDILEIITTTTFAIGWEFCFYLLLPLYLHLHNLMKITIITYRRITINAFPPCDEKFHFFLPVYKARGFYL